MLRVAVIRSERVEGLFQGAVRPFGLDVEWLGLGPGEIFDRMLRSLDFDASEMSLPYALMAQARGSPPLVSLPIFLGRGFRHQMIFARAGGAVKSTQDLAGRTFALPDFFNADALWVRETLAAGYGVDPRRVRWVQFGRGDRMELPQPSGYEVRTMPGARPEELLRSGEADVAYLYGQAGRLPAPNGTQPLFGDPVAEERAFFSQTGLFPITHCVVMRAELYQQQPEAARSLYDAFLAARDAWYRQLVASAEPVSELPWHQLDDLYEHMGRDFWPHGVAANRRALEVAVRRLHEDGYLAEFRDPSEWFVPELRNT